MSHIQRLYPESPICHVIPQHPTDRANTKTMSLFEFLFTLQITTRLTFCTVSARSISQACAQEKLGVTERGAARQSKTRQARPCLSACLPAWIRISPRNSTKIHTSRGYLLSTQQGPELSHANPTFTEYEYMQAGQFSYSNSTRALASLAGHSPTWTWRNNMMI